MTRAAAAVVLAVAAGALAATARAAQLDACTHVSVSPELARRAFGAGSRVTPLTEPSDAPANVAHVPACFVWVRGTVVATVRLYPSSAWDELTSIYAASAVRPRRVALRGLGPGASLYAVPAQPGSYEQDLVFRTGRGVVTVRSAALPAAAPPRAPRAGLFRLARSIRTVAASSQ